jgi:HSP20 family protein
MALVRWEPIRLFNTFFDTPTTGNGRGNALRRWIPATDLVETDEHFVLKADLPGLSEEDVAIEVKDNVLTVSGERKAEHEDKREGYVRVERAFGSFRRSLTLPEGVDPEAVKATFDNGVLEVRIPKPEERKPRKVAIQVGERPAAIEGSEAA